MKSKLKNIITTLFLGGALLFPNCVKESKIKEKIEFVDDNEIIDKDRLEEILEESGIQIINKQYKKSEEFDKVWGYLNEKFIPKYNMCMLLEEDSKKCLNEEKLTELMNKIGKKVEKSLCDCSSKKELNAFTKYGKIFYKTDSIYVSSRTQTKKERTIILGDILFEGHAVYDTENLKEFLLDIKDKELKYGVVVFYPTIPDLDSVIENLFYDSCGEKRIAEWKESNNIAYVNLGKILETAKCIKNNENEEPYELLLKISKEKGISYEEVVIKWMIEKIMKHEPVHHYISGEGMVKEIENKTISEEYKGLTQF